MSDQANPLPAPGSSFLRGLAVQGNVIGALVMRELHTRYGRDNIGYLWMVLEPMTLATAVSSTHYFQKSMELGSGDIRPVPFTIVGYCVYIIFRQVVSRAEGILESNTPLLYHRMVSVFDMVLSRAILETAGVTTTLLILLSFSSVLGVSHMPARPLFFMAGVAFMVWLSFSISMIICAATNENRTVARLIHPFIYIGMPVSGAFWIMDWLPRSFRNIMVWSPMAQIFELVRYGEFFSAKYTYVNLTYIGRFLYGVDLYWHDFAKNRAPSCSTALMVPLFMYF